MGKGKHRSGPGLSRDFKPIVPMTERKQSGLNGFY